MIEFHNWIDINKIDFHKISENSNSIEILKENKN
jgi:hypothetical protein